jgi:hypothetical protein
VPVSSPVTAAPRHQRRHRPGRPADHDVSPRLVDERGAVGPGHGPFHRLESPTQTPDVARLQQRSGEIWGRTPKGGLEPTVQAYRGPLPEGARGIEFFTDVVPNSPCGPIARWSLSGGRRSGLRQEGEFAKITCQVTRNTQC